MSVINKGVHLWHVRDSLDLCRDFNFKSSCGAFARRFEPSHGFFEIDFRSLQELDFSRLNFSGLATGLGPFAS